MISNKKKEDYFTIVEIVNNLLTLSKNSNDEAIYNIILDMKNCLGEKEISTKKQLSCLSNLIIIPKTIIQFYNMYKPYSKEILDDPKHNKKKTLEKDLKYHIRLAQRLLTILQIICLVQTQTVLAQSKIIMWVDDNPSNNTKEVKNANTKHGIKIIQKVDTASALNYLKVNSKLANAQPSEFRIITDYYRPQEGDDAARLLVRLTR